MIKKLVTFLLAIFFCFSAAIPVSAEDNTADKHMLLMDEASLLTGEEELKILDLLDEISQRQGMDVVVVTVESLGGKSAMDFADDYFDYNGYGQGDDRNGVLLLHSPEERDWWISTRGYGITVFTDAGIEYIGRQVTPKLADDNFAGAYTTFAKECDKFITQAKNGKPYDKGNLPAKPLPWYTILIAILIGFISALGVVGNMKSKLKTVRFNAAADSYIRMNSMKLTDSRERFLYSNIVRVKRPKESSGGSSTHRSSSGASHGGGGGKY